MNLIKVENINATNLKIYHQMRDNIVNKANSFIADSPKVVNELLKSNLQIKSLLATKEYYKEFENLIITKNIDELFVATKKQMQIIVGHKIHHNCMAHGIRPKNILIDKLDKHIVMLDGITSSENVGSIARSMAAFGVNSYIVPKSSPHPYARRALRVSMGYVSKLKILIYENIFDTIKELKKLNYKIYGAEITKDSIPLKEIDIDSKWVLLMGHEGHGISKEILNVCDKIINIEISNDVKSLNVATAASLIIYQFKNHN